MSPILAANRSKYPAEWKSLSYRIRFDRGGGQCEFLLDNDGNPSVTEGVRCGAIHGEPHPISGSMVVLTTAHLDHDPGNNDEENLRGGCQRCHNRWDRQHRAESRKATRSAKAAAAEGCA